MIRAIQEHKNLAASDKSMIDTYCRLFELDWRGDTALENREQFMMNKPIYIHPKDRTGLATYGDISNERVVNEIKQACQPFLPQLLQKMQALIKGGK